jgi:SAM-dependent methyltransferase
MISFLLRRLEASPYRRQVKAAAESVFLVAGSILRKVPGGPRCPVCSARLVCLYRPVMGDELVGEWGIDETWRSLIDRREGEVCLGCGSSLRVRQVAATLLGWLAERGGKAATLDAALREDVLPKLSVAEINSCGAMHGTLVRLPKLAYSEYLPESPNVVHEDLLALSYRDESFDLVLHSDSLEHVPDVDRALSEIYRVMKPGGASIFSVPIILDGRKTVVRAEHRDGVIRHLRTPTYHGGSYQATRQYLVYYDFGVDFPARVSAAGFDVRMIEHETNRAAITFIAGKPSSAPVLEVLPLRVTGRP